MSLTLLDFNKNIHVYNILDIDKIFEFVHKNSNKKLLLIVDVDREEFILNFIKKYDNVKYEFNNLYIINLTTSFLHMIPYEEYNNNVMNLFDTQYEIDVDYDYGINSLNIFSGIYHTINKNYVNILKNNKFKHNKKYDHISNNAKIQKYTLNKYYKNRTFAYEMHYKCSSRVFLLDYYNNLRYGRMSRNSFITSFVNMFQLSDVLIRDILNPKIYYYQNYFYYFFDYDVDNDNMTIDDLFLSIIYNSSSNYWRNEKRFLNNQLNFDTITENLFYDEIDYDSLINFIYNIFNNYYINIIYNSKLVISNNKSNYLFLMGGQLMPNGKTYDLNNKIYHAIACLYLVKGPDDVSFYISGGKYYKKYYIQIHSEEFECNWFNKLAIYKFFNKDFKITNVMTVYYKNKITYNDISYNDNFYNDIFYDCSCCDNIYNYL